MTNPYSLGFNSGTVFSIDNSAVPTPVQVGVLQSASVDLKAKITKLYGQNILPVAAGRAQVEVSGKFKFSDYNGRLIGDWFGASLTGGQDLIAINESGVAASEVYQTVNHSTFTTDLGVRYSSTNLPLVAVASGPAQGQYTQSSGSYTLNASDSGTTILVSYMYTTASSGDTILLANTSAGAANQFKTIFDVGYQGNQINLQLNAAIASSLKLLDTKLGEFTMPEWDFDAICDASGNLGILSVPNIS